MRIIQTDQIIAVEQKLLEAVKQHNIHLLDTLLHDDLLFHLPDGQILTKAKDLEMHRSGDLVIEDIKAEALEFSCFEETALVSVLIELRGTLYDQPMAGRFRYLRVWKAFGENLKVIGGSCVQI